MSLPGEDFATRRAQLTAEIARQRVQLADAYQQLERPLRYTEYGMKGFAFIRQNQWILTAAPALVGSIPTIINLVSSAIGWKKKKKPPAPVQTQVRPAEVAPAGVATKMSRASQALMTGAEHGLRAYNIYRRVRSIIS